MSGEDIPKVIGEYTIMRPVARGVMGMVYVATTAGNVFHAIKVLDPKIAEKLPWAPKFRDEIRDEHILNYKAIDITTGDRTYFVSEYLEVKPIARHRLPGLRSGDLVEIVAKLAESLQKVHDAGLAHGNIKTSNILVRMVEGPPQVYISDFGIGYIYDPDVFTQDKVAKTFPYMSPERIKLMLARARGKDALPTPAMDIYSLGVTLCEILTGSLAYSDVDTPEMILEKKKKRQYLVVGMNTPIKRLDLPKLNEVVAKSTAFEPKDRFKTMREFADALRSCIIRDVV